MSISLEYKKSDLIKDCVNVVLGYLLNLNNIEYKVMPHVYAHLKEEWNKRFDSSFWPTVDDINSEDFDAYLGEIAETCSSAIASHQIDINYTLVHTLEDYLINRLSDNA